MKLKKKNDFRACDVLGKNKCRVKCYDCVKGQRNMREGRYQNIFKHWTNRL